MYFSYSRSHIDKFFTGRYYGAFVILRVFILQTGHSYGVVCNHQTQCNTVYNTAKHCVIKKAFKLPDMKFNLFKLRTLCGSKKDHLQLKN